MPITKSVGLGSCIGTIIYDETSKIGGLSHIMLPDSKPFAAKSDVNPAKFADTAIPLMYQQLKRKVPNGRFKAKVVGGANTYSGRIIAYRRKFGEDDDC